MNQIVAEAIVLRRVDYQEADRILTVLTNSSGKVSLIAKGARRSKSKLAGGIELFSVSDITYIKGRKEIGTLTSSRLKQHFPNITSDLERVMPAYKFLKLVDKICETETGEEFFSLLIQGFAGLNDEKTPPALTEIWFGLHLLNRTGHAPNFKADAQDVALKADKKYNFDYADMRFAEHASGLFQAKHIKLLRYIAEQDTTQNVSNLVVDSAIYDYCNNAVNSMIEHSLPV